LSVQPDSKRVVVGRRDELERDRCLLRGMRWIPFERPEGPVRGTVRIRSTHPGSLATVTDVGSRRAEVRFESPESAITPGQAAVVYDGDLVVGGGWICA
jgi:tRNA-specific 2-thiouridylase